MSNSLNLDAVIVGGGIMGLWLLKDLRAKGYTCVLLETGDLGGQQTCHSHVYLHQGHIYNAVETTLASKLRFVGQAWSEWLAAHQDVVLSKVSFFGFKSEVEYSEKTTLWTLLGLDFRQVPRAEWPEAIKGGEVVKLASTTEASLEGNRLIKALLSDAEDSILRITGLNRLNAGQGADGVHLVAALAGGGELRINARFAVLAAGSANLRLIGQFQGVEASNSKTPVQQIRKGHMLVIRGPKSSLPPLTGVFGSFGGLFIVSREVDGEVAWLISDYRSPVLVSIEDWLRYDPAWWLPGVLAELHALAPVVFRNAAKLQWGIYDAPKAEGANPAGTLPDGERIVPVDQSAWAIWPTKLTLAPQGSKSLIDLLGITRARASNAAGGLTAGHRPRAASERFTLIPYSSWPAFCRFYSIDIEKELSYGAN